MGGPTISRILYLDLSIPAAIIHLGFGFLRSSSGLPGNQDGPSPAPRTAPRSLFGLAPCGVCQADPSPDRWCALTAPFHPYWEARETGVRGKPGSDPNFSTPIPQHTFSALRNWIKKLGSDPGFPRTPGFPRSQRYVFCCTFRPLRALELRGTLPCGVRTFLG